MTPKSKKPCLYCMSFSKIYRLFSNSIIASTNEHHLNYLNDKLVELRFPV